MSRFRPKDAFALAILAADGFSGRSRRHQFPCLVQNLFHLVPQERLP